MYSLFVNTHLYLQTIFLFNCLIFCNWEILCLQIFGTPSGTISTSHLFFINLSYLLKSYGLKNTQIKNPLFGKSEVDPLVSNSSSSSDISYAKPMTTGRTKDLAKVYAQATSIPQPSLVLNTSKVQKSRTTSPTQGASKDVTGMSKKCYLSQLCLKLWNQSKRFQ